jgi:hypothetical protein
MPVARVGSPDQRPRAPDRGDDVEDRLTGGGGGVLVHDQVGVGSAGDHAVHAVGRQGGEVVLECEPCSIAPAAGCQDDQGLVGEVTERCSMVPRGRGLAVLVERALKMARGSRPTSAPNPVWPRTKAMRRHGRRCRRSPRCRAMSPLSRPIPARWSPRAPFRRPRRGSGRRR